MMIYNISNFKNFFESLDQCDDDLTLITPDGKSYDWKKNRLLLKSLLQTMDVRNCSKMEIRPCGPKDASRIMCYMLEGERSS